MNSQQLLLALQQQYDSFGYIDVTQLDDPSYEAVFTQLGIPTVITLAAANNQNWQSLTQNNIVTISFSGSISGNSIVMGLAAGTAIAISFTPLQNTTDAFQLQMDLSLPAGWRFGNTFLNLNNSVYKNIQLTDPATHVSKLTVIASVNVVAAPATYPSLEFTGYINPNSSVLLVMTQFLAGGIQQPVSGRIDYVAETGAVDMNLLLANAELQNVFESPGTNIDLALTIYSGLNPAINLYEAGIRFETDILVGSETVSLEALYSSTYNAVISLRIIGLDLAFVEGINSLAQLFPACSSILSSIPNAIEAADLSISGLTIQLALQSLQVNYIWLAVSALENTAWEIWPSVITLSNLEFSFTIYSPLDPQAIGYAFQFAGLTRFGGENGLPLLVRADLPGLVLSASLNGGPFNLQPLLTYVLGDTRGLPETLYITDLSFKAFIPENYYAFNLQIDGVWSFAFGEDKVLDFREMKIHLEKSDLGPSGTLVGLFSINTSVFTIELDLDRANQRLLGGWADDDNPLDYQDIAIAFGMYGLPGIPQQLDLALTAASFELETAGPSASFTLTSKNYGSAAIVLGKDANGNWGFVFGMIAGLELNVNLTDIDVVGNFVPQGMDVIAVNNLRFIGATTAIPLYTPTPGLQHILGSQINSGLVLSVDLNIGTLFSETFSVRYGGLDDGSANDVPPPPQNEGNDENPPVDNNNIQLDVNTTPAVPTALPGPTSAWINVQRSFGPVHIARIGFRITEDNSLGILLDAGVNLAGLTIGLSALEADIPVSAPFLPDFSLAGLEIGYVSPGFTLAGALVKAYGVTPTMYTGELILQAGSFGASAFGSYTTVNDEPSLFAFLALNIPIGGPPFCVVTGLSVGFGYNRRLILPTIETVQTYPLVQAAMGITNPQQTIDALNQYIVPADNQYWLAAGIRFTSFEMLNAYALLTVSFGTQVELALMGEALLTLPLAVPGEEELILAQADMVLLATINPSLGQIAVSAQLTSRSFVLDRNAQITGGFAFFFWFGNSTHKGDFVVTLGGYNPYFSKPAYYPRVPLLGLNWQISSLISIKGGLYCALTPSVIMAGGNLSASYTSGNVKAWFNANADFLIRFKPFSFDATIGVSVGASYKIDLYFTTKTVSVTVGASLKLWGPPFAGTATVALTVMSFTIAFGAAKRPVTTSISWAEFRNSFLPPEPSTLAQPEEQGTNNNSSATQSLIRFNADRGLISTAPKDELGEYGTTLPDGAIAWRMNPGKSKISITTAIPSKTTVLNPSPDNSDSLQGLTTDFGIGPMSISPANTGVELKVEVYYDNVIDHTNKWSVKPLTENVPSGLWKNTSNSMTGDALVENVLQGIQLTPKPTRADVVAAVPLSELLYGSNRDPRIASWSETVQPADDYFTQGMTQFSTMLVAPNAITARNTMLGALAAQGLSVYGAEEIDVNEYATEAPNILYAAPRICYLGETTNTSYMVISQSKP